MQKNTYKLNELITLSTKPPYCVCSLQKKVHLVQGNFTYRKWTICFCNSQVRQATLVAFSSVFTRLENQTLQWYVEANGISTCMLPNCVSSSKSCAKNQRKYLLTQI